MKLQCKTELAEKEVDVGPASLIRCATSMVANCSFFAIGRLPNGRLNPISVMGVGSVHKQQDRELAVIAFNDPGNSVQIMVTFLRNWLRPLIFNGIAVTLVDVPTSGNRCAGSWQDASDRPVANVSLLDSDHGSFV